jgi:hypothetical protein
LNIPVCKKNVKYLYICNEHETHLEKMNVEYRDSNNVLINEDMFLNVPIDTNKKKTRSVTTEPLPERLIGSKRK